MQFESIAYDDLEEIKKLQPDDWSDIIPYIKYYIDSDFCYTLKAILDERIVGIGVSVMYPGSSWLAHIIVANDFRNKGIGFQIVDRLIHHPEQDPAYRILLTATTYGEPVYRKHGFRPVTDYIFFNREKIQKAHPVSKHIVPFHEQYRSDLYDMDNRITGEDRRKLLSPQLYKSLLYTTEHHVLGFYLPDFGEGLIMADSNEAGLELMKLKYGSVDKAVLPVDNTVGINFLKENGFVETPAKGLRMILGEDFFWQPENIYSRIGGNFG